ncbi:M18 family aminopeptidase [Enteractinococcus fodinae]|uniref:M18 family aminopeptidase n=1 Tax=Enteractinococcus fodinae TaxID=684663 RepID=A0ABU2AWQ4_9MICC|nr:M18 family aminopeptidase [Enteractinococcus fodinae]MDR7345782.1 aspartyl aminopeptidase [Enteractinococcus fodinae]
MTQYLDDLAEFIHTAPSPYHVTAQVAQRAAEAGFTVLDDAPGPWPSEPGGYVLVRDGAVIAWKIPEQVTEYPTFHIVGAHTDSPTFRVKPLPDNTSVGYARVGVEVYGGVLVNSWLDRDLGFAGRLITADEQHLVRTPAMARIPQLAIHLDRSVNDGLKLDRQQHLVPIVGVGDETNILAEIAKHADVEPEAVQGFDLVLTDTQAPATIGVDNDFFAAPRLDNLVSVHAGLRALLESESEHITVLAAFDHEEVGSETRTGAGGPLLGEMLGRILDSLNVPATQHQTMISHSIMLSADGGHLVHPNYPERHDPQHYPLPNAGPILKVNATQRYLSDGHGAAKFVGWADQAGVPHQVFVSKNTQPSGSTIGPISATRLGMETIDAGIGLLSMHSVREMCGAQDPEHLAKLAVAFYQDSRR